jgi:hypothetical protein
MFSTLFVDNVTIATIITILAGIPWAVAMWVPFSLLGEILTNNQFDSVIDDSLLVDSAIDDSLFINENSSTLHDEDHVQPNSKQRPLPAGLVLGIVIIY